MKRNIKVSRAVQSYPEKLLVVVPLVFFLFVPISLSVYAQNTLMRAQSDGLSVMIPQNWQLTFNKNEYLIEPPNNPDHGPSINLVMVDSQGSTATTQMAQQLEVALAKEAKINPQLLESKNVSNGGILRVSNFTFKGKKARMVLYLATLTISGRSSLMVAVYSAEQHIYEQQSGEELLLKVANSAQLIGSQTQYTQQAQQSQVQAAPVNTNGIQIPRYNVGQSCQTCIMGCAAMFYPGATRSECMRHEQVNYNIVKQYWPQTESGIRQSCINANKNASYKILMECVSKAMNNN